MKIRVTDLREKRERDEKIVMVTAYDACFGRLIDEAGVVDVVLVGDSLGTVIQGRDSTIPVTLDHMVYHATLVRRGVTNALLAVDLPFLSAHLGDEFLLRAAGRLVQEAGADAVKVEGGAEIAPLLQKLTRAGIPVIGHIGLQPQQVQQLGGYRVQGRTVAAGDQLVDDGVALEEAGVCSIVIEAVPPEVAQRVTDAIRVPTIGIGAGAGCSGQVLVMHDLLGLSAEAVSGGVVPKFVKQYAALGEETISALRVFASEVRSGAFPAPEHTYRSRIE